MWSLFRRVIRSPLINMAVGGLMVASALAEIARDAEGAFGVRHGLLVAGLLQALKAAQDVVDGIDKARGKRIETD